MASPYGRSASPDDNRVYPDNARSSYDRTLRAVVVDGTDTANGYVKCEMAGLQGSRYATLNPLWMSFPKGAGAAWGRYAPFKNDILKVSFDTNNRLHIIGYDIVANKEGIADDISGWPQLNDLHINGPKDNDSADIKTSKERFKDFMPLNPGEFDFMSTGWSYIKGDNTGKLYMAGGKKVSISLIKGDNVLDSLAQLFRHNADTSIFRFGQTRRVDTRGKIVAVGDGKKYEHSIVLKNGSTDIANVYIGDIYTENGTESGNSTNVYRFAQNFYKNGNLTYEETIDAAGKVSIHSRDDFNVWVDGDYIYTVDGKYIVGCNNIYLGAADADQNVIRGKTYWKEEKKLIDALQNAFIEMAANMNIISGVIKIPYTGGALASPSFQLLGQNCTDAAKSCVTFTATASTPNDPYLSEVSRTK